MKIDPEAEQTAASDSPGATLSGERKRQGLSLSDIARQIKLSPRQVEALERDDFPSFRGAVFVHGFLRNYARLLRIDPKPLVMAADAILNPTPQITEPPREQESIKDAPVQPVVTTRAASTDSESGASVQAARNSRTSLFPTKMTLLGVTAAVIVITAHLVGRGGTRPDSPVESRERTQPARAPANNPAEQDRTRADAGRDDRNHVEKLAAARPAEMGVSGQANSQDRVPKMAAKEKPLGPAKLPGDAGASDRTEAPASSPPPAGASVAATVESATLHMVFEQESWVEVKDGGGKTIFAQLNPAGSERSLQGLSPMSVVVGNANGVRISVNDRSVSLEPHTRVNVARLILP